jgi:hypothetical protein
LNTFAQQLDWVRLVSSNLGWLRTKRLFFAMNFMRLALEKSFERCCGASRSSTFVEESVLLRSKESLVAQGLQQFVRAGRCYCN